MSRSSAVRSHFHTGKFYSGILFHEDGSRFQGTPVPSKNIHYYYCPKHKLRIRKDFIEEVVFKRIKEYLEDSELLPKLIESANTHKAAGLPFVEEEMIEIQNKMKENTKIIEGFSAMLRKSILMGGDDTESIIRTLTEEKETAQKEALIMQRRLNELEHKKRSLLDEKKGPSLAQKIKAVLKTLDQKPEIEKRRILQSIIKKIVVFGKSKIEMTLVGHPQALGGQPGSNNRNGIVVDFRHDKASYSPPVSLEPKNLNLNLRGVTDEAAGLGSGKLAGSPQNETFQELTRNICANSAQKFN